MYRGSKILLKYCEKKFLWKCSAIQYTSWCALRHMHTGITGYVPVFFLAWGRKFQLVQSVLRLLDVLILWSNWGWKFWVCVCVCACVYVYAYTCREYCNCVSIVHKLTDKKHSSSQSPLTPTLSSILPLPLVFQLLLSYENTFHLSPSHCRISCPPPHSPAHIPPHTGPPPSPHPYTQPPPLSSPHPCVLTWRRQETPQKGSSFSAGLAPGRTEQCPQPEDLI